MADYWMIPRGTPCDFLKQFADVEAEVNFIMRHVPADRRGFCIQAGGSIGLWAIEYAKHFELVETYEPDPVSYAALCNNVQSNDNIEALGYGLAGESGWGRLEHPESDKLTCGYIDGVHPVDFNGSFPVVTIDEYHAHKDDLWITKIGLIHLDIEGGELGALKGARETIDLFSPTIVFEDHDLPHARQAGRQAAEWLREVAGYRQVAQWQWQRIFRRV